LLVFLFIYTFMNIILVEYICGKAKNRNLVMYLIICNMVFISEIQQNTLNELVI
jgi:hypothetical protein